MCDTVSACVLTGVARWPGSPDCVSWSATRRCRNRWVTSFGEITGRDIAMVAVEDADGAVGWGDIWGNFPPGTTAYRAGLAGRLLPGLLLGRPVDAGAGTLADMMARTRVLAIQSGEHGPVASAVAAADQALWDLAARRRGVPVRRLIDPGCPGRNPGLRQRSQPR